MHTVVYALIHTHTHTYAIPICVPATNMPINATYMLHAQIIQCASMREVC